MDRSTLMKYREAGRIASKVRERTKRLVKEGMSILKLCELVEGEIRRLGGFPAFPCNVSIDHVAAHYTSPPKDDKVIPRGSIVKVDIGVHVDGYIADTAVTVCFRREWDDLIPVAEEALARGVGILRPRLSISNFGSFMEKFIKSRGFKPIQNLTGHQVDRYLIHAGKSLPNVSHLSLSRVKEGEVIAVEPFVTTRDAGGKVRNGPPGNIFRLIKQKPPKDASANKVMSYVKTHFRTLPFAERWLIKAFRREVLDGGLTRLLSSRNVMVYPTLVEVKGKPVAQAEHTVLITRSGCEVLT